MFLCVFEFISVFSFAECFLLFLSVDGVLRGVAECFLVLRVAAECFVVFLSVAD